MAWRFVIALGISQCVNWGILYYAFAVLLLPVERHLGVARWIVAGAFSVALLMSAALAPVVGRWSDRGHGARVMQAGGYAAAALLIVWALVPTVLTLYLAWAGLGLCMAATLYEPAFAIVGRAHDSPARRLRALATVTLFGGLASTIFLPSTAMLVRALDWRGAVVLLACVLAASTFITSLFAGHRDRAPPPRPAAPRRAERCARTSRESGARTPGFAFLLVVFSATTLASAALTSNLVPALGERSVSPATAATLGGLFGVMQLPGRALLMNGRFAGSPFQLLFASLVLQSAGLAALAIGASLLALAGGLAVFALGSGLTTLVRPHLVQTVFSLERAGYLNGQLARSQQLARAAGPVLAASLAAAAGYGVLFVVLVVLFAVLALASRRALSGLVSPPAS